VPCIFRVALGFDFRKALRLFTFEIPSTCTGSRSFTETVAAVLGAMQPARCAIIIDNYDDIISRARRWGRIHRNTLVVSSAFEVLEHIVTVFVSLQPRGELQTHNQSIDRLIGWSKENECSDLVK
jgi:hypothetical protein